VASIGIGACEDDDDDQDTFSASLTGAAERPTAVSTTATGNFILNDNGGPTLDFVLTVNNLTGPVTGAHIHAIPRSGVAPADTTGGVAVNLNPIAGITTGILAQGNITAASIQALPGSTTPITLDSLRTLMIAGRAYVNVHTQANPGGHIRGTLVRQ
jgi:hypothetical protein